MAEKCPLLFPERSGRGNIFVLLQGDKVPEDLDHLFQRTDGDKFVDGVEIETAGGEGSPGNEEIGQRTKRKDQPGRQFRLAPKRERENLLLFEFLHALCKEGIKVCDDLIEGLRGIIEPQTIERRHG